MNVIDLYIRATSLGRRFDASGQFGLAALMHRCAVIFAGSMATADINRIILSEGLE